MPTILLGIDGGGTRTRAALLEASPPTQPASKPALPALSEPSLRELGRGEAPSCNHYSVGWDAAVRNLVAAALEALNASGHAATLRLNDPSIAWGRGLAGAVSSSECREWEHRLRRALLLPPSTRVRIAEDVLAAQSGAFAAGPGAILIAGTGANAFRRNSQGQTARADGLGPLLGDRGSGFWIGEAALRATARHHDRVASCPP